MFTLEYDFDGIRLNYMAPTRAEYKLTEKT